MLPARNRLRRSSEFTSVVRSGRRLGGRLIVVHRLDGAATGSPMAGPARVGFVVSRAVGGSVVRNHVSRRLRAQTAARLPELPAGSSSVVRALPAAATATSRELGVALDRAFGRLAPSPADSG